MKIGIDARVLMNEKYSGVAWYAFNLLSALFEIDSANKYVLFYNSQKEVKLPELDYPNASYKVFHWPNKLFNLSLNFFSWPKLDRLVGGCDVFFSPNLHFVSWSDKCRKAIVVHDLSFLAYPDFFTLKQRLWHKLILNKKILSQADVIIADSHSTKRDLIDLLDIAEEKIKVIYPGPPRVIPIPSGILGTGSATLRSEVEESLSLNTRDPSITSGNPDFSRDDRRVKIKYNLPEKYFLFVSTIEPRKNLAGAIKAMESLPADVKLVVAGEWGWKTNKLKVESLKLKGRIIFLGYVSEEEKMALYQNATALVYPSFYEGFGLPILEAMALGCPMIAGNNSSQGEVLGDCGLLIDPFNANEIKQAMELMLTDDNLRQEFIRRGLKRAQNFSWQKTAEQVLAVFRN